MRTHCFSVFKTKAGDKTRFLWNVRTEVVRASCKLAALRRLFFTNAKKNVVLVDDSQSSNDITQYFNIHKSPILNKTSPDFPLLT